MGSILGDQYDESARKWSSFFRGWQELAGLDIAAHSRVKDVKRGTVIVEVDHPGWLQMLQMRKVKILRAVKKRYPELCIEDMRIYLNDGRGIERKLEHEESKASDRSAVQKSAPVEQSDEYKSFRAMLERLRNTSK